MTTTETNSPAKAFRLLPRLTDENRWFWTSGADGVLRFLRCQSCGYYVHPYGPRCPRCLGSQLEPEAVSGTATLHTFTVNHQPWYPGLDPPYVVAIVELPEQQGLRLTTGIVGCGPDDVAIGMPVRVVFDQYEDVWLPFFEPDQPTP